MYDLIIVGGGAAGVFASIQAKIIRPDAKVLLLEKSAVLLAKVKVSGGGRCNVTHACFDPNQLVQNYPRGHLELRGPFHRFQPRNTIEWFESRGVTLKAEADGRIFPTTDSSQTIIDCLLGEAKKLGVEILMRQKVDKIIKSDCFEVGSFKSHKLLLATGSAPDGHKWAEELRHTIQPPVPSLFTFNVPESPLKSLSGISVQNAEVKIIGTPFKQKGPLLITHFGFSGPAVLKLSAWAARTLHEKDYHFEISIDWLSDLSETKIYEKLLFLKTSTPNRPLDNVFGLPKNLWKTLIPDERRLNDISLKDLQLYAKKLHADVYQVQGKTTHKEEFVTCGGITLKEIDFKTMESKVCPGLYFAGEILDIDGVTGGFNFQSAWTTGYIAGSSSCN